MEDPLRKDVKYLGPKSQNKLTEIIAKRLIQRKLIDEINEVGIHSIFENEIMASNYEVLSICIRYVNNQNEIYEVFMEFVELEKVIGKWVGKAI